MSEQKPLTSRPKQRLRRRIRWSLALLLLPLVLAGAAEAVALTNVVEAFRGVAREQERELVPSGPLEADIRLYENAAYGAFHTDRRRELDVQAPKLERAVEALISAMDEQDERDQLRETQARLDAAAVLLRKKLAEPFPQRSGNLRGDPLAQFAELLNRAVESLRMTQRVAIEESDGEVRAANSLQRRLLWVFALLVLLTAGAALLIARGLGRDVLAPLGRLEEASRRIGAGELEHRLAFARDDELGAAGAAFDSMVEQIEEGRRERQQSQARLHESQKLEAVGELAGGIAHDFNNLLQVVQGYTTLVAESLPADDSRLADLGIARAAAERAAKLTQQLLTFSRREIATPAVVDVNQSVTQTQTMLRRLIPTNVAVDLVLDPAAGTTTIDPVQLEQVVVNLVLNARDAIGGGGRIVISSARVNADETFARQHHGLVPGEYVAIGVRDDGSGMSREIAERIFEPFYTTKPRGSGTGLGLAVTHGIVQRAGGAVTVYSEPGLGSTLTVYLPASGATADPGETQPARAPALPSATVLVAEDEASIRTLIERVLREAGITAVIAGSAEEAIQLASDLDGKFDLLLSDLVMPGKSGSELADDLAQSYGPSPVVFISGYSNDAMPVPGEASFLQKPFTRDSLLHAIADGLAAA